MSVDQSGAGAPLSASTKPQYSLGMASRVNQFPQSSTSANPVTMPPPSSFMGQPSAFNPTVGSQAPFQTSQSSSYDRNATNPIGTPFGTTPSPPGASTAIIRNLPLNTSEEQVRLMLLFSHELIAVEVLPADSTVDPDTRTAVMTFKSPAGAREARSKLSGKGGAAGSTGMVVEILAEPTLSPSGSNSSNPRQPSRFNPGHFSQLDAISPPMNGAGYGANDLQSPEPPNPMYHGLFSPQSPMGRQRGDTRITGKSLIKDNDAAEDDETGQLLKDPVAFAESAGAGPRRATAPHVPISQLASLSMNVSASGPAGPSSLPPFGHPGAASVPTHPSAMSPIMNGTPQHMNYSLGAQFPRHNLAPPVNPADQNPPCNTLYVGNLPMDTSEEELKAIFSKQRGYKRLCFRTKQNGPMCFVEFEDVSFATKALHELYGLPLHNSTKGGIRLSFSKNPLGVRSGQTSGQASAGSVGSMNGMSAGSGGGFTTTSGPPPGLSVPPGLASNRMGYGAGSVSGAHGYNATVAPSPSNSWNGNGHIGQMPSGGPSPAGYGAPPSHLPPHMMGL